jgi:hypothetical protein
VPNIVLEVERYVFNVSEATAPIKFPLNCERNPGNEGVVRFVADAMIVSVWVPVAPVLTFREPRSIDSGSVTRLLISKFMENVPKLWFTKSGSVVLVVENEAYPDCISSIPRMGVADACVATPRARAEAIPRAPTMR